MARGSVPGASVRSEGEELRVGDAVEIVALEGVEPTLVGKRGKVVELPGAGRVTVEMDRWFSGNFRRAAVRKIEGGSGGA